jgi:hypothetical protein
LWKTASKLTGVSKVTISKSEPKAAQLNHGIIRGSHSRWMSAMLLETSFEGVVQDLIVL